MPAFPEIPRQALSTRVHLTLPEQPGSPQQGKSGLAQSMAQPPRNISLDLPRIQKMLGNDKEAAVSMGTFAKLVDSIRSLFGFETKQEALSRAYDEIHKPKKSATSVSSGTRDDDICRYFNEVKNLVNEQHKSKFLFMKNEVSEGLSSAVGTAGITLHINGTTIYDSRGQQKATTVADPG